MKIFRVLPIIFAISHVVVSKPLAEPPPIINSTVVLPKVSPYPATEQHSNDANNKMVKTVKVSAAEEYDDNWDSSGDDPDDYDVQNEQAQHQVPHDIVKEKAQPQVSHDILNEQIQPNPISPGNNSALKKDSLVDGSHSTNRSIERIMIMSDERENTHKFNVFAQCIFFGVIGAVLLFGALICRDNNRMRRRARELVSVPRTHRPSFSGGTSELDSLPLINNIEVNSESVHSNLALSAADDVLFI